MWFQQDVEDTLLPRAVNTEVGSFSHYQCRDSIGESQQRVSLKLSPPRVGFVLSNYFLWKQPLRSSHESMRTLEQRKGTCPVVRLGSGTPASTWLSIELKWTNHIDCFWARLQLLIRLGDLLTGTQALHTHHRDWLDFKPAQDAGKFVCCRVRRPLNPHVLLTEMTVAIKGHQLNDKAL